MYGAVYSPSNVINLPRYAFFSQFGTVLYAHHVISSPSKKAEASGDEQSGPTTASRQDCSFAAPSCSLLAPAGCFQLPLHPSVPWGSGTIVESQNALGWKGPLEAT